MTTTTDIPRPGRDAARRRDLLVRIGFIVPAVLYMLAFFGFPIVDRKSVV